MFESIRYVLNLLRRVFNYFSELSPWTLFAILIIVSSLLWSLIIYLGYSFAPAEVVLTPVAPTRHAITPTPLPTPTPTPLPTPTPTPLPTPTPREPPVPPTPIATPPSGRLEITYPDAIVVEDHSIVTAEVIAISELTALGNFDPFTTGVIRLTSSQGRNSYEATIPIFPVMEAELQVAEGEFTVGTSDISAQRDIMTTGSASWVWSVKAQQPGQQTINVNIFGITSASSDAEQEEPLRNSLAVVELAISVMQKPLGERLGDWLSENGITLLLGLFGTTGPIALYLSYKSNEATKEMKQQANELDDRLKRLEDADENGQ